MSSSTGSSASEGECWAWAKLKRPRDLLTDFVTRCCTSDTTRSGSGPKNKRCKVCLLWICFESGVTMKRGRMKECSTSAVSPPFPLTVTYNSINHYDIIYPKYGNTDPSPSHRRAPSHLQA